MTDGLCAAPTLVAGVVDESFFRRAAPLHELVAAAQMAALANEKASTQAGLCRSSVRGDQLQGVFYG